MSAAVTRFFSLFEPNTTVTATAVVNRHQFRAVRFPGTLLFRRYSSSSASVTADDNSLTTTAADETAGDSQLHPWPEWVTFVDRLKTKGYIIQEGGNDVAVYKDMAVLKNACFTFARDRFDLFKSLPRINIRFLVEKGCPNIKRKSVNSAKRLRAHLKIEEANACGACVLRGSCDRANVKLKDDDLGARTEDVVRILLNYALDPAVDLDKKPLGAEFVEAIAKKLLLKLTELSDKPVDPESLKHVSQKGNFLEFEEHGSSEKGRKKRKNWLCSKCQFYNFDGNEICHKCKEVRSEKPINEYVKMRKDDWICSQCGFNNFSRNLRCVKCETMGPKGVKNLGSDDIKIKKGDWNCPRCRFMNFASNVKCLRCREHRPKMQLNIGEWQCTSCDFFNFAGNVVCRKCNLERPKDVEAEYQEQMWRQPS